MHNNQDTDFNLILLYGPQGFFQPSVNVVQPKSPLQGVIPSLHIIMSHLQKQVCKIQSWLI